MANIEKKIRHSNYWDTEYQIEYKQRSVGFLSEYRVRRGIVGTWTKWFQTRNMHNVLRNLGFGNATPSLLNDFYFVSYFGRGQIQIDWDILKVIVSTVGVNPLSDHLYSRIKKVGDNEWIIPSSALETKALFKHLRNIIAANNK